MSEVAAVVSLYKNDQLVTFQQAMESLIHQSYRVDIFVQQDGKIDLEVEKYLDVLLDEKKIVYLGKRDINLGIAPSYNELFAEVLKREYKYIARMDADDIAVLNRMEVQYNFMKQHTDIDVVGGYIEEFGDNITYDKVVTYPLTHKEIFKFFSKRVPLANPTTFFRKRYFERAGLYPLSSPTNEDTLFWMYGFQNKLIFANIPQVLVKMRISENFFQRRGGIKKAWSDFKDRVTVIKTLDYGVGAYLYAMILFAVNISPPKIKQFLYKRFR